MQKKPIQFFVNTDGEPAKFVYRILNDLDKIHKET